ncbi:TnsD family Tn7-like transposition protein [Oceanobacillus arenosus]|uniref:TnsD family Tn7-like transposition protein n=1 Tax=Oceanobacillus arenosus TaxID=1229153 RepID=UPI0014750CB3|nr:TnsD family Tn7-like transposition protein [Oceanobacillus arenosus]
MLTFFTDPYPDELIYSAISRFHFYSGNTSFVETLEELFQSRSLVPSIEFGSHFSTLVQNLGSNYSVESLLAQNTVYPYFAPFITIERQKKLLEDVSTNGQGIHGRLGISGGKISRKQGLFYCSKCANNDINIFGEPYVHREHQLQGIDYCPHHELTLKMYPIDYREFSRNGYIRFDRRQMDLSELQEIESYEFKEVQVKLAKMAYRLLQIPINQFSIEKVFKKYRTLLRENNWLMTNTRLKREELFKAFISKFPQGFLEKYESLVTVNGQNQWLQIMVTNYLRNSVHPFRHLLLLYFFDEDIDSFLEIKEDDGPFGRGPWPCLNKAAKHYKDLVISDVEIKARDKVLIGKFSCSCGFEYTRVGPDKSEDDKWSKSRITAYGKVWEEKFEKLVSLDVSREKMALELDVSLKTIYNRIASKETSPELTEKYRAELLEWREKFPNANRKQFQTELKKTFTYLYNHDRGWLDAKFPSKRDTLHTPKNPDITLKNNTENRIEYYRSLLLDAIKECPDVTRTQLSRKFQRAYKYLSETDKEWFDANLPRKRQATTITNATDWELRDQEYYQKIKEVYPELMALEKPVRITGTLFSKRLNIFNLSVKSYVEKLPQTNKLLNEISETVQEFQIRRCCKVIDRMLEEDNAVRFERLRESCAVETKYFKKIKPYLEEYISKKQKKT